MMPLDWAVSRSTDATPEPMRLLKTSPQGSGKVECRSIETGPPLRFSTLDFEFSAQPKEI